MVQTKNQTKGYKGRLERGKRKREEKVMRPAGEEKMKEKYTPRHSTKHTFACALVGLCVAVVLPLLLLLHITKTWLLF